MTPREVGITFITIQALVVMIYFGLTATGWDGKLAALGIGGGDCALSFWLIGKMADQEEL